VFYHPLLCELIESIDLTGNLLSELPHSLCDLRNLKLLNLDSNHFNELPEVICILPALERLSLKENPIDKLSNSIYKLRQLKVLDLDESRFACFPESICQLEGLESLQFGHEKTKKVWPSLIPQSIGNMRSLKWLSLSANNFRTLPESIGTLSLLEVLILSRNNLSHLPFSIEGLQNLRQLNLNSNLNLSSLPNQIFRLPIDCEVDLQNCGLSPSVFSHLQMKIQEEDYQGPRLTLDTEKSREYLFSTDRDGLPHLFWISQMVPINLPILTSDPNMKRQLELWLGNFGRIVNFRLREERQTGLARDIVRFLTMAENNPEFRAAFFSIISNGEISFDSRMPLYLLYLKNISFLITIDRYEITKIFDQLLRGVWVIELIEKIAREKIPYLPFVNEYEVYLNYCALLKPRLDLLYSWEAEHYFMRSYLTEEDLYIAECTIRQKLWNPQECALFLIRQPIWIEALRLYYVRAAEDIDQHVSSLSEQDPQSIHDFKQHSYYALTIQNVQGLFVGLSL
jgi:hypothetical protein